MTENWTDRIVGDRMAVDQTFADRIEQSQFSRQQWGLVMTAVEFEIEHPADDEQATLVADTSRLPDVLPEIDAMEQQGPMGGGAPGGAGGRQQDGDGMLDGIKDALGFGGSDDAGEQPVDQEQLAAATQLAEEYATELQAHLEDGGKWADVRAAAGADQ